MTEQQINRGGTKKCYGCKKFKALVEFSKNAAMKDGLDNHCRCCRSKKRKKQKRSGKQKRARKNWSNSDKGKVSRFCTYLKHKFNMTVQQYEVLLKRQNNKCAICKNNLPYRTQGTCIDHNHQTGKVRGILCRNCNLGLGFFQDDLDLFVSAMSYLQRKGVDYSKGDMLAISWYDIVENSEWRPLPLIELQSLPLCRSVGWFLHETSKHICLLMSINGTEDAGMEAGNILIPKAVIKDIELIREDELDTE